MEEHSVLQRKVSTSSGMSKGKMLLLLNRLQSAFFKACYESCGVQLKSRASTMSFGCLSDLREELEGFGLLGSLAARGWTPGFMGLTSLGLSNLIEFQTIGQAWSTSTQARKATLTEAALIAPFIDRTFKRLESSEQAADYQQWISTIYFSDLMTDVDALMTQVDNGDFICFKINFSVQDIPETCQLILGFNTDLFREEEYVAEPSAPEPRFNYQFLNLEIEFTALLHRFKLSSEEIRALSVGDVLTIPLEAFQNIELVGKGGGQPIKAILGKAGAYRAVKTVSQQSQPIGVSQTKDDSASIDHTVGQEQDDAALGNQLAERKDESFEDFLDAGTSSISTVEQPSQQSA